MEQAGPKPETIKLVSPNGTKFRWSYYVTPDEYKGVRKWKGELLIPVGSQMKNEPVSYTHLTLPTNREV